MFYLLVALAALCVVYLGMKALGYSPSAVWKSGVSAVKAWLANWQN
jgi:hypothetical protein